MRQESLKPWHILELRGALKGEAEGVRACNNRLYRFQYCLLIAREIAVSNALETREDLVLLRRLDVVNNVNERTQRSLFTPVSERFLLVLNQDLSWLLNSKKDSAELWMKVFKSVVPKTLVEWLVRLRHRQSRVQKASWQASY
jgi:hypothetical protein